MKVLLTGASGFVGSHILDQLLSRGVPTRLLLRPSSVLKSSFPNNNALERAEGSLDDPESLRKAVQGVTHVIHCAGATRAVRPADFFEANAEGTRRLVQAINASEPAVERLVHISSLAAAHPATRQNPAREDDPPAPVSAYGRSKLAGEDTVRRECRIPWVILRPPAVYGPRDVEFLRMFRAARWHIRLALLGGPQELSLVHVHDLAEAAMLALNHPAAPGRTYYVAHPDPVTPANLASAIAAEMGAWTIPLPMPAPLFWPICLGQTIASRLLNKPSVLGLHKYPELVARGWICDPSRISRELGFNCRLGLNEGLRDTLAWYRKEGWL